MTTGGNFGVGAPGEFLGESTATKASDCNIYGRGPWKRVCVWRLDKKEVARWEPKTEQ